MRQITPFIFLCLLLFHVQSYAQTYSYAPSNPTSTAFGFGSTNSRHHQTIYRPGFIVDSTLRPFTVNRLYFRRGDTFQQLGVRVDSLVIRWGATTARNFVRNSSFLNIFFTGLPQVYDTASIAIAGGAQGTWFSFLLDTPFIFNPAEPQVLDVLFKDSNTPSFALQAASVFTLGVNIRATSPSLTSPISNSSSGLIPHIGVDVVTALLPRRTLQVAAYPNPTTGSVSLNLPNPTSALATLVGTDGRAFSMGTQSGWDVWTLPNVAAGVYTMLVTQGGQTYTARLSVQ